MATGVVAKLPLVAITGPTASGKTALAIELAEKHGGEIICADSRTIYKGMDIGTAKPTAEEQARVPHWGIDLVEPGSYFSAADFKKYAFEMINQIRDRGHIPFLVGGTGLYVDAVLFDYQFGPPADNALRTKLKGLSLADLHKYCIDNNIKLPENNQNKRYLIRAIEQGSQVKRGRQTPINMSIIVGIATDKVLLRQRIEERTEHLFNNSVVDEATLLGKKYGWKSEAMTGNIYPLIHRYLKNELTYQELKNKFTTADWRLAKRQMTYLKRNPFIKWLSVTEAAAYITAQLVNEHKS